MRSIEIMRWSELEAVLILIVFRIMNKTSMILYSI
jgi:hypothetical protein